MNNLGTETRENFLTMRKEMVSYIVHNLNLLPFGEAIMLINMCIKNETEILLLRRGNTFEIKW